MAWCLVKAQGQLYLYVSEYEKQMYFKYRATRFSPAINGRQVQRGMQYCGKRIGEISVL
jgi:hypothetical protein